MAIMATTSMLGKATLTISHLCPSITPSMILGHTQLGGRSGEVKFWKKSWRRHESPHLRRQLCNGCV